MTLTSRTSKTYAFSLYQCKVCIPNFNIIRGLVVSPLCAVYQHPLLWKVLTFYGTFTYKLSDQTYLYSYWKESKIKKNGRCLLTLTIIQLQ